MPSNNHQPGTVLMVTHDGLGTADLALQHEVVRIYFALLLENGCLPGAICFYTEGVKLVADGSPVLEQLRMLADQGVHLIVCRTCLEYYGLVDSLRVGIIGGMGDIIAAQWKASKVITV